MFIYSVRASTVKFFGFIALTLAVLLGIVFVGNDGAVLAAAEGEVSYGNIKTAEDRLAFIKGFGIEVDESSVEEIPFTMPENFDRVILGYNELQKKQGLDLSRYARKKVTRYVYRVTNYDHEGEVYASIFVYKSKIVACDLSSAEPEGFVIPLTLVDRDKLK